MPELPEVEVIKNSLARSLVGERITAVRVRRKDLRYPAAFGLRRLEGCRFRRFSRRGKYLLCDFERRAESLVFHMGMSGRLRVTEVEAPILKHDHVLFATANLRLAFFDPRRFGSLRWATEPSLSASLRKLGPEPQRLKAGELARRLVGRTIAIKPALLDQSLVAGLGNIYACEALFASGINPQTVAAELPAAAIAALADSIRLTLSEAIKAGGSTIKDHLQPTGEAGYFQIRFRVYGREDLPCFVCKSPIIRIVQAGRATFYCSACQR